MSKQVTSSKTGGMKILNKARCFKLNTNESIIDGNTVAMPFIAEYKGKKITSLEYEWTDSKGVKRGLELSGHGSLGIPTLREKELFISLQRIFIRKKTKDGVCELKIENLTEDDLIIDFTMAELGREMGYKSMSTSTRQKFKDGIKILVATTVFNRHAGGIYDIVNKRYINDSQMAFHYIESISGSGEDIEDVTKIKLSKFVYDTIAHSYNIFYNIKKVDGTNNLIAKNIYRLALQWKGNNNFACATIQTLIDRNPMGLKQDKAKKQQIKKALRILEENNMLQVKYDEINPDKVYMIVDGSEMCVTQDEEKDILKQFNTFKEVKQGLMSIGYTEDEIEDFDIEDLRYIKALLRYYKVNEKYTTIECPKNYFEKCYNNRIVLNEKYFDKKFEG